MVKKIFYSKHSRKRNMIRILRYSFLVMGAVILGGVIVFAYYAKDLPRPERFTERALALPTKIYDRSGTVLLYQIYGEEKRTVVSLSQIPPHLKQAVVLAEDANFYNHFGLDWRAIVRAVLTDLKLLQPIQGASTITQQLVRSSFLIREKTLERKIREIVLTLELERRYSKDQILEWYLNEIPFGSNTYGVEAASQSYFNKTVSEVSLAEAVTLAAIIRAPSLLSPYGGNKEELLARKDYLLDRMADRGFISQEEAQKAKQQEIKFSEILQPIKAPHFSLYVKQYLESKYSPEFLQQKGLKVYTTLDWELQQAAEKAVEDGWKKNQAHNAYNAALVALDPRNGEILAMVGSADYFAESYPQDCTPGLNCLFEPEVNVAVYGKGRQPGSAIKPFVYAKALQKGYTADTILWDVKTEFNSNCTSTALQDQDASGQKCYHPGNYDGKFRGPLTLRQSLAQSINVTSVKVLYLAGLQESIDLARNCGITTLNQPASWYGLSLVLGGGEVKLLDIVSAYGVFATSGFKVPPLTVMKIEDSEGNIIEENKKDPQRILNNQIANLINDILSDNEARFPVFNLRSALYIEDYQVAAKTGTTQDFKDGWTIGYTPSLVIGVWAGNNNQTPMGKEPGVSLAGPIWQSVMTTALKKLPKESFAKPQEIPTTKPVLQGIVDWEDPHSILFYTNKNDPQGAAPQTFEQEPQFQNWEANIQEWVTLSKKEKE